jgi:hypothetical protein
LSLSICPYFFFEVTLFVFLQVEHNLFRSESKKLENFSSNLRRVCPTSKSSKNSGSIIWSIIIWTWTCCWQVRRPTTICISFKFFAVVSLYSEMYLRGFR